MADPDAGMGGNFSDGPRGGNSGRGNESRDANGLTKNQVGYGYRAGSGDIAGSRYGQDVSSNSYSGWGGTGQMAGGLLTGNLGMVAKGAASNFGSGNMNNVGSRDNSRGSRSGETYGGGYGSGYSLGSGSGTSDESNGGSIYPSVYTDPVTGRLLYQSQSVGGTSNLSYADQQLLDQLMGTKVAGQNIKQQINLLTDTINKLKASGADASYYEKELARLQGLGSQTVSSDNPLLQAVNSGASARAANQLTENTAANQLRAGEETAARRGLGTLGSPMNDQLRASLGLSTAQARTQNQATAEKDALANRMDIMSFLKNSQNQDYTQDMGRTGIGMTLGDWENQRKIAEIAQANSNSQFGQNMDYLQGLQDDANTNAWISTIGDVAGNIDWGSFF